MDLQPPPVCKRCLFATFSPHRYARGAYTQPSGRTCMQGVQAEAIFKALQELWG